MATPVQPVRGTLGSTGGIAMYVSADGITWTPFSGAGAGGTSSTFGAAFPAAGTAAGFKDVGGNMAAGNLDAGGNLKIAGSLTVAPVLSATATLSTVAVDGASHLALAANVGRQGVRMVNKSTTVVYLKYGVTASPTSFTDMLLPGESWPKTPWDSYDGRIDMISDANDGTAGNALYITELTV